MNAFLLLTSAVLAGAEPVATPAADSCCNGSCGSVSSCCDSGHGGFLARLKALCHRGSCDSCSTCNTCAPAPVYKPAPTISCNTCDSGCGGGLLSHFKGLCHRGEACAAPSCGTCSAPACCAPVVAAPAPSCNGCGSACGATSSCSSCDHGCGGFLARLKAHFHKSDCCDTCNTCDSCATAAPVAAPAPALKEEKKEEKDEDGEEGEVKKLPSGKSTRIVPVEPPALRIAPAKATKVEGSSNPFELDRRYEERVARAADYSWLTGQLFFVHADGGIWVLRYAPLSKEDANGGGVILARGLRMDSYREGDLVSVKGEILEQNRSKFLGAPTYRAASIHLEDRAGK